MEFSQSIRIRRRARRLLGLAAATAIALPFAAATPAGADWKADWEKLVAAAKKEGKIEVGAPRPVSVQRAITAMWKRDFPEIAMRMSPAGTGGWPTRIRTERKAGKYLWDVYYSGPSVPVIRMAREIFDPLLPLLFHPEVADPEVWGGWQNAFVDRGRNRLFAQWRQAQSIYYDAKAVSPERVKKLGFRILLEPEFKGKIAWQDPRGRGPGINPAQLILRALGEEGLRKAFVDQEPKLYGRAAQALEEVIRGNAVFYLASNMKRDIGRYEKAGIKTDIRPFGNRGKLAYASVGPSIMGFINKAPHPNAAKLFINWVLTKRIQTELTAKAQYESRRRDVPRLHTGEFATLPDEDYQVFQTEEVVPERRRMQALLKKWRPS